MSCNIEIKVRLNEPTNAHAIASRLSGAQAELITQRDVFFRTAHGRLKLRMFPDGQAELIQYCRPNTPGIRLSDYRIARTTDAEVLLDILASPWGRRRSSEGPKPLPNRPDSRPHRLRRWAGGLPGV